MLTTVDQFFFIANLPTLKFHRDRSVTAESEQRALGRALEQRLDPY